MILFDGCSWTWGAELGVEREKLRFSQLLGEKTNMDYVNIGYRAKSNNAILRTTLEYCEKNTVDIAIIQFTCTSRTEVRVPRRDSYIPLTVGSILRGAYGEDISRKYYEHIHNDNEEISNFHKNKFLLEYYFKSKNIPYFFVNIDRPNTDIHYRNLDGVVISSWGKMMDQKPVKSLLDLLGTRFTHPHHYAQGRLKSSDTIPRGHPNILGHKIIAEYIYDNFLNKYVIG
jgi:hypothetical protein|tara:strand:- start:201 stop:887 length:687 start_codon:yes stop_codon:yes gene_type:complete